MPDRPILILGLGNILMRDEGVGVRTIEAMRGQHWPENVELLEGGTAGLGMLDAICGRRRVIVLDAVQCEGAPGTIVQFRMDPAQTGSIPCVPVSLHEVGFVEVLHAARLLGAAPYEVIVLGVRPAAVEFGLDLSPEVAAVVPKVIAVVQALTTGGKTDRPKAARDPIRETQTSANRSLHGITGRGPVALAALMSTRSEAGTTEESLL